MSQQMSGPGLLLLAGVRVVDFTQALAGPYGTMMLGDLGAEVIKIENPHRGDDSRHWGPPFLGADSAYFMAVNRNKKSLAVDLKDESDLARVLELVKTADVVMENWRPGTAARLGLGPDELQEINPRLIYCSISGYGQDQGPLSGYDQIVQGTSGVMHLTGPVGEPTKWGVPIADIGAGMYGAAAILAALYAREQSGKGSVIDISLQDCMVSMLTHYAGRYLGTGEIPQSDHNGHHTIAPYGLFRSQDGFVNVCVGNDSQFARFCEVFNRPELAVDPRFVTNPLRLDNKPELLAEVEAILQGKSTAEIISALESVGVPVGAVVNIGEVLDSELTRQRNMVLACERSDSGIIRAPNTAWKFDGQAPTARLAPPLLGEHNEALTSELTNHTVD